MPVTVIVDADTTADLVKRVDEDIEAFDKFFQGLGNEPLSKPEKAIIKTFLAYKTGVAKTDHA